MLTKGLDNYQGTAGNDTIIGSVDDNNAELNTMSTLDVVNGGAGVDTLKVAFNAKCLLNQSIMLNFLEFGKKRLKKQKQKKLQSNFLIYFL